MLGTRCISLVLLACLLATASACTYRGAPSWREQSRIARGEAAVVLYRYTKGDERVPSRFGLAFWSPADRFKVHGSRPFPRSFHRALSAQGWYYQVLEPGRHVSLVEHKSFFDNDPQLDAPRIEFGVPEGASIVYVGSIHVDTQTGEPTLTDESTHARAIIEAERAEGGKLARVPGTVAFSPTRRYDRPLPSHERIDPGASVFAFVDDAPVPRGGALRGMVGGMMVGDSPGLQIMGASMEAGGGHPLGTIFITMPGVVVGAFVTGVGSVIGAITGSDGAERERIRELEEAVAQAQIGLRLAERVAQGVSGHVVTEGAADVSAWITRMDFPRVGQQRCIEIAFRVRAQDELGVVFFDRIYVSRHPDARRSSLAALHELPLEREPVLRPRTEWRGEAGPDLLIDELAAVIAALGERVRLDLGP